MKTKKLILLIVLVVIIGGFAYFFSERNGAGVDGWQIYSNPTIGLSLQYPPSWKREVSSNGEDPITHGDILKNGALYTTFTTAFSGPDKLFISVVHAKASYDGKPVSEQLKAIDCPGSDSGCQQIKNRNSVTYVRWIGCDSHPEDHCTLDIIVPTGKYILDFSTYAGDMASLNKVAPILDQIAATIRLE